MSIKKFEVLQKETVYNGFYNLEKLTLRHTLYNGSWSKALNREFFHRNNCVAVLLYDPVRDEIVLIEQFRVGAILHTQGAWLQEIVAGAIEENETAEQVAVREAQEEAGCEIIDLIEIMQFYTTPGASSERVTLFCGRVDSSEIGGIHGLHDEDEDIFVSVVKTDEAFQMLDNNQIESGIAIIAIQWLCIHRNRLRKQWLAKTF